MIGSETNGWRIRGSIVSHRACLEITGRHTLGHCRNSIFEFLLSACDDTLGEVRECFHLVNIYTDAIDIGIAGCFENALSGQTGDLEEYVCLLGDELFGDRLTGRRVIEALRWVWICLL